MSRPPDAAPPPATPGRLIGRALWTGAVYGAAYGAVEALGAVLVFEWLGAGAGILRIIEGELFPLLLQYVGVGVVLGVVVAPAVAVIERFLPPRWRGPGINFQLLGLAFIAIAFFWNPDSVLPRRFYVFAAFGAQGLILLGILLGRLVRAATRRLRPSWRRPVLAAVVAAAAIVLVVGLRSTGARSRRADRPAGNPGPNVVLIVVDTLRRDHLSAYGYSRPTSPHIDRLAAEGALFERAYSTASWTLPAHASLFTGLYVSTHGTDAGQSRLPSSHPTMAQILAARGYRTAAFSANPWVTSLGGFDRGFERFDYVGVQTVTGVFFVNLVREGWRARRGLPPPDLGGEAVTDGLLRWIRAVAPAGRPFFGFANYMEAHEPYGSVPEPFFSTFLDAPQAPTVGRQWVRDTPLFLCASCSETGEPAPGLQCAGNGWRVTPERLRAATALYDAGVLYVDHQIGRVVEALDAAGLRDQTLVIVTSDHGESLGERGQMGHGGLLYNSVLDVPLVARYPRLFPAGTRVAAPVSLVDVLPAVTAATGSLVRTAADARDLAAPDPPADRAVLAEYFPIAEHVWKAVGRRLRCDYHRAGRESASLQKEGYKYVWSSSGDHELFDLAADPAEEHSVLGDHPEVASRLDAELKAWRARLRSPRSESPRDAIDPATRKALESLGYVN